MVQQRAEAKDYLDLDALMTKGDISLPMALSAGLEIYKNQFNPQVTFKALSYIGEAELAVLPDDSRSVYKPQSSALILNGCRTLNASAISILKGALSDDKAPEILRA